MCWMLSWWHAPYFKKEKKIHFWLLVVLWCWCFGGAIFWRNAVLASVQKMPIQLKSGQKKGFWKKNIIFGWSVSPPSIDQCAVWCMRDLLWRASWRRRWGGGWNVEVSVFMTDVFHVGMVIHLKNYIWVKFKSGREFPTACQSFFSKKPRNYEFCCCWQTSQNIHTSVQLGR